MSSWPRHWLTLCSVNTRHPVAPNNRQREALARVSAQQAKLSAVKSRYESGQKLAAGARNVGVAGVGVATAGVVAGGAVLKA
ncbi:hypothetical protein HVY60_03160 [Citrobacter freundii]|uniref:hypothetical protein n=1 Tax=Citrobacter freundii TaxID=546 RepID=UPI0015EE7B3B|nr:hypothetical protein HVY60_03160 [Citrobacter freundii]